MAKYPDGGNDWCTAIVQKKVGNKYLVNWYDGDKTHRKVTEMVPIKDVIVCVKYDE